MVNKKNAEIYVELESFEKKTQKVAKKTFQQLTFSWCIFIYTKTVNTG
jgi:hypothetical protein